MDVVGNMFANISFLAAACLTVGLILVAVEIFIPGFGAPGIMGTLFLISGVIMSARNFIEGMLLIMFLLALIGIFMAIMIYLATHGKLPKSVILTESLTKESGFSGTKEQSGLLGREGITRTALRPAGTAIFDGVKVDVVSEGEFIVSNTKVKVIQVEGRRVVVQEIISEASANANNDEIV